MGLSQPTLTDGIVLIRPSGPGDLEGIAAGIHDPDVVHWIGPPRGSAEDVLRLNEQRRRDGSPTFSICDAEGRFAGLVWVNVARRGASVGSIGYWLLPDARGRGLATRAVRLISAWAVPALGLSVLRITTEVGNDRSAAVAERSEFERVGLLLANTVIDGRSVDSVLFERRSGPTDVR